MIDPHIFDVEPPRRGVGLIETSAGELAILLVIVVFGCLISVAGLIHLWGWGVALIEWLSR